MRPFTDTVTLPGSLDENGKGTPVTTRNLDGLSRKVRHTGPAWYRRRVALGPLTLGRRLTLFLERCHWSTTVWVDGQRVGAYDSLSTPHTYDLTTWAGRDEIELVLCIDNRAHVIIGRNSHCITDQTQTNWNGAIGELSVHVDPLVGIARLDAYPTPSLDGWRLLVDLINAGTAPTEVEVKAVCGNISAERVVTAPVGVHEVWLDLPAPAGAEPWDDEIPALHEIRVTVGEDAQTFRTGLRRLTVDGPRLVLNGRTIFLRGNLNCCEFPLTGYPPCDLDSWRRIYRIARSFGINHIRFHTWCPPEAAFAAADELGMLLGVEFYWFWGWDTFALHPERPPFVEAEARRVLRAYGHHPSLAFIVLGNEVSFHGEDAEANALLRRLRDLDDRCLYAYSAHGNHIQAEDQFMILADNLRTGADTRLLRGYGWQPGQGSRFNEGPAETTTDYRSALAALAAYNRPVIAHEVGQWCVYPDFRTLGKYTGVLEPRNMELIRDQADANGVLDRVDAFVQASGRVSAALYRQEVEACLRTPELAGFQLLSLQDFPGQGTACVGLLDPFWDSKGVVDPADFARACGPTVPLARLPKRIFTPAQPLDVEAEVAHYGRSPLGSVAARWELRATSGAVVAEGTLGVSTSVHGGLAPLGKFAVKADGLSLPASYDLWLEVQADGKIFANHWSVWAYPDAPPSLPEDRLLFTLDWQHPTRNALLAGRTVLCHANTYGSTAVPFTTAFWSPLFFKDQAGMMSLLIDHEHPAFADFPTDFHADWQWSDIVRGCNAMDISTLPPGFRPMVEVIDRYDRNRRHALILEARVGRGRLLLTSVDLRTAKPGETVRNQLRHSVLKYLLQEPPPTVSRLSADQLDEVFRLSH